MKAHSHAFVLVVYLLLVLCALRPAHAQSVVVGVNVPFLSKPSEEASRIDQEITTLNDLKAAGVRVIRTGIAGDQTGLDFAKRIHDAGLKLHWEFGLQYAPGAKLRPWQPDKFPSAWAQYPLSAADPDRFRAFFQPRLDQLEAMGIELAAFELTAEINMTPFNGDFPLPGKGRIFSLSDLYHDPEGRQLAKGYLQYLKVLAVLKDIRDRTKLNRHTPIVSAGLGSYEFPEGPSPIPGKPGTQTDVVSSTRHCSSCVVTASTESWMPTDSMFIRGTTVPGSRRPPTAEGADLPNTIWPNVNPPAVTMADPAGSPNGDLRTEISPAH